MTTSVIAGVNLEEISKHLKCSLCSQLIRNPKLLPCLHSFCQTCIQEKAKPSAKGFCCPECDTEVRFRRAEAEKLQTNFFIDNMLDVALIKSEGRNPVLCTSCDLKASATSRCVDCGEFLCENCYNVHKRIRQTKEHRILTIQELLANKTGEVLHRPAYCNSHLSEALKYFCDNCSEALCRDCVIMEHRQHKYDFIHDSKKVRKQKDNLAKLLESTTENIPILEKSLKDIRNLSDRLHGRLAEVKRMIRETTQNHIKILKEREEQLLSEADRLHEKKSSSLSKQLEELELHHLKFKTGCDFTYQVLKYSNEVEMLSVKTQITERLNELKSTRLEVKPRENGHLNYILDRKYAEKAVALSLGSLNTTGALVIETAELENGRTDPELEKTPSEPKSSPPKESPIAIDLKNSSGKYVPPILHQGKKYLLSTIYSDLYNYVCVSLLVCLYMCAHQYVCMSSCVFARFCVRVCTCAYAYKIRAVFYFEDERSHWIKRQYN